MKKYLYGGLVLVIGYVVISFVQGQLRQSCGALEHTDLRGADSATVSYYYQYCK